MYSDAVIRHALDADRAGGLGEDAAVGRAGDVGCGDTVEIALHVKDGRVVEARHRSLACPHGTAAAALLCELAEGRDLLDAARIGQSDLEQALAPRDGNTECLAVAADAYHAAIAEAVERAALPAADGRVAVAMSGGVDSAVALLKAVEAGFEPVGVTLRLWIDPAAPDSERACCSPSSVRAARSACHALGVPHVTLDLREPFRRAVVEEFVGAHRRGLTPNPCVRCNGSFRFDALIRFADRIGAPRLATGHYARLVRRDGRTLLARGADPGKDQSYMLASVPAEILERVWFPLGEQRKTATREEARGAGLEAAGRAESQEVCFVGGGDHRAFLERHGGAGPAGEIVSPDGEVLGRHDGVHRFTAGQRRGIGVGGGPALYVLHTDAASGRVVAGTRDELAVRRVTVSPGEVFVPVDRARVRLRYRGAPVPARVVPSGDGFELELDEPAFGVAAGQAAVLYDGDTVVGSGRIASSGASVR
jgi:tRNA-specific 2-thiouridylase